ncbi:hypothetical protein KKE60_04590 [Patescibacteria group bacterium]|nr:hypothetical protein [Patescibacteria group bacterium]
MQCEWWKPDGLLSIGCPWFDTRLDDDLCFCDDFWWCRAAEKPLAKPSETCLYNLERLALLERQIGEGHVAVSRRLLSRLRAKCQWLHEKQTGCTGEETGCPDAVECQAVGAKLEG